MTKRTLNTDIFAIISDPVRRSIVDTLLNGQKSVNEIVELFDVSQSAISQHLRLLREANLVTAKKEGRTVFYEVNPSPLKQVYDWVSQYERFWQRKLEALDHHLRKRLDKNTANKRRNEESKNFSQTGD